MIDFFVVGVQKAGTTALADLLRPHPGIQVAGVKEVHFFDNEAVAWDRPDYSLLERHFDRDDPAILVRGEATPIYTYWPHAVERLRRYNADAKLIMCLRHPSYRAHSHWRMETVRGDETLSFEEAITEPGVRRVREAAGGVHRVYSYLDRGFYASQVRRLQQSFPATQLLFLRTEDLWSQPQATIMQVERFLGVSHELRVEARYIVPVHSLELGGMSPSTRAMLDPLFASDILATEQLTGLALHHWLDPAYREPMPGA